MLESVRVVDLVRLNTQQPFRAPTGSTQEERWKGEFSLKSFQ